MNLNKMLVLTALAAGGLVACGSAFGQDATTNTPTAMTTNATPHTHGYRGANIDRLAQRLDLSDSQKQQVQSVLTSVRQQMRDVHEDTSLSPDERHSKMTELRDSLNTKMQSILTPDQYARWQKLTHSHHSMHHTTPMTGTNAPDGSAQ